MADVYATIQRADEDVVYRRAFNLLDFCGTRARVISGQGARPVSFPVRRDRMSLGRGLGELCH